MNVPGLVVRAAVGSYVEALARADRALAARGIVPAARIDHQAAAADVGLSMAPCTLFVFGNPRAGTLLMQGYPSLGIDLPLRLLVWEQDGAKVAYNDPAWLVERHDGEIDLPVIGTMQQLLAILAAEVAGA
ncbi:DUF302 domain-containing protein [Sphingomonas sp. BK069]|uniref:DUF302 domain-containing protein n=1 Tax=Sphingomonas sp. BK069 TaxID=2586979 RepID=UPI0016188C59|nr:DUF302 domain-containing protein [Sphingomonas sp. BK069]MBB3348368.1 uncharacterized protein (DUF302 family) [Sphingomonas sp. BK069]